MIVPQFWAEARIQQVLGKRQITVRRFGWSDVSQDEAQRDADTRAREAMARLLAGEQLPRRDLKRPYNGSVGVPIREEIVARYGETVITRNSYGALCLNTPNVLFADIDFDQGPGDFVLWPIMAMLVAGALVVGWFLHSWLIGFFAVVTALLATWRLAVGTQRLIDASTGGPQQAWRRRLDEFLRQHPEWHVRLYETPAGMRLLAMHKTFDPQSPEVTACFAALKADPIYVQMCQRQNCFRARLTPKPWRIGVEQHLKPRPGTWPVNPERLPQRQAWIAAYEQAARSFAACQFRESLGSGVVDPAAADVQRIHDELCQANQPLGMG
jgi:hypothetical protein